MANYQPANVIPMFSGDCGNSGVYWNKCVVSTALAAGDKARLCVIPAGTRVDRVVIKNDDLDTGTNALTAKIGFEHVDGSSGASDTAVAATGANALTGAATTTYEIFPPVVVEKDAYLQITAVVAANAMASAATVYGKVEGEVLGVK